MILIVDDDPLLRAVTSRVLAHSGFEARAVDGVSAALEEVAKAEPELILCDVVMPGGDGFEFRRQYLARFPRRDTPFVFLTAREDPQFQVESLESGVEDYLVKPVSPAVLVARVRRYLARRAPSFHGSLVDFDVVSLLRFCERQGLNGQVEVVAGGLVATLGFQKGLVEALDEATLDRLVAAKTGTFTIRPATIDFSELPKAGHEAFPGRRSSLALPGGLVDVETAARDGRVESTVTLNGKLLQRDSAPLGEELSAEALAARVAGVHADTEAAVRVRLAAFSGPRVTELTADDFTRRYEAGFTHFAARRYAEAVEAWEAALALEPAHGAARVNLEVARRRLAAG